MKNFIKRINPYSGIKGTKAQYEMGYKSLAVKGLGNVEEVIAKNGSKCLKFKKLAWFEIGNDPVLHDKFPRDISSVEYERMRMLDEESEPGTISDLTGDTH